MANARAILENIEDSFVKTKRKYHRIKTNALEHCGTIMKHPKLLRHNENLL